MSHKTVIKAKVGEGWRDNGVRFATREEAEAYGQKLYESLLFIIEWEVQQSSDPVNFRWTGTEAKAIGADSPHELAS
jgi:hypothetical protein